MSPRVFDTHTHNADGETEAENIQKPRESFACGLSSGGLTRKTGSGILWALPSL